jgi:hemin uptake protein HemP
MVEEKQQPVEQPEQQAPQEPREVVRAEDIFRGRREVCIELDGVRYRLRITRRNKLILQK